MKHNQKEILPSLFGSTKSLPHWYLLLIPKVKICPLLVNATACALPSATCTMNSPFNFVTNPVKTILMHSLFIIYTGCPSKQWKNKIK